MCALYSIYDGNTVVGYALTQNLTKLVAWGTGMESTIYYAPVCGRFLQLEEDINRPAEQDYFVTLSDEAAIEILLDKGSTAWILAWCVNEELFPASIRDQLAERFKNFK